MTHSNSQRLSGGMGGGVEDKHREREQRDMEGWDLFFSLLFFSVGLTQVSADMLGAGPGVDYNIETTTGNTRRSARQQKGSE